MIEDKKACTKCKKLKPRSDFYQHKRGTVTPRCKPCERAHMLAIYHADKEKWRVNKSAWLKRNRSYASEYERLRRQKKKEAPIARV